MRVAIVMGQSEYVSDSSIPSSKRDIFMMSRMINLSAAFDKVLVLDDSIKTAENAKEKIIVFIDSCKKEDKKTKVTELFFYYTGRGDFSGKEFYYLWGDYDKAQKKQTSILNSELDTLIRQINPRLVVKIVDACYPGFLYYNSSKIMEKFLRAPEQAFDDFYFIFSNHNDRFVCGDDSMSYFTSSIYRSVNKSYGEKIRYNNIIEAINTDFSKKRKNAPIVVVKAENAHFFVEVNDGIKNFLQHKKEEGKETFDFKVSGDSIIDVIKRDAQRYVELPFALSCVTGIGEYIEASAMNDKISGVYEKKVDFIHDYESIPKIEFIAKWLSGNGGDIYAEVVYETKSLKEEFHTHNPLVTLSKVKEVSQVNNNKHKHHKIAKSYIAKLDLPYIALALNYCSKYPNITDVSFYLVPLLSRTQIFLFFTKVNYINMGWAEQKLDLESVVWSYVVFNYDLEMIRNGLSSVITKHFEEIVYSEIVDRFLPSGKFYGTDRKSAWQTDVLY
jgi:hypothetical protein